MDDLLKKKQLLAYLLAQIFDNGDLSDLKDMLAEEQPVEQPSTVISKTKSNDIPEIRFSSIRNKLLKNSEAADGESEDGSSTERG